MSELLEFIRAYALPIVCGYGLVLLYAWLDCRVADKEVERRYRDEI